MSDESGSEDALQAYLDALERRIEAPTRTAGTWEEAPDDTDGQPSSHALHLYPT